MNDGEGDTDVYTSFFIENFDQIVDFYIFTKYGPFKVFENIPVSKRKLLEVGIAYMMMEIKSVRFELLAKVTGVTEQTLIRAGIEFIAIYKGEEYKQGAYLIEIYTSITVDDNFIKPMQEVWASIITHEATYAKGSCIHWNFLLESPQSVTVMDLAKAEPNRGSLSPKVKQYTSILENYFSQQEVLSSQ